MITAAVFSYKSTVQIISETIDNRVTFLGHQITKVTGLTSTLLSEKSCNTGSHQNNSL